MRARREDPNRYSNAKDSDGPCHHRALSEVLAAHLRKAKV